MKSELNITILPERNCNEPSPDDVIMGNYPGSSENLYLRYYEATMLEIITVCAWNTCKTWPNGQQLNMDRMLSRKRLYSINGKDC